MMLAKYEQRHDDMNVSIGTKNMTRYSFVAKFSCSWIIAIIMNKNIIHKYT